MAEALPEISELESCPNCSSKLHRPGFARGRVVCIKCGWSNQPIRVPGFPSLRLDQGWPIEYGWPIRDINGRRCRLLFNEKRGFLVFTFEGLVPFTDILAAVKLGRPLRETEQVFFKDGSIVIRLWTNHHVIEWLERRSLIG
jgi:hypothetical protein